MAEMDVAKILAAHFASRPWDEMAEDKTELRRLIRVHGDGSFDINEPTQSDCIHAACDVLDAIA